MGTFATSVLWAGLDGGMSKASKALFPLLAHCAYGDSVMQYLGAVKPDLQASLKLADLTILIKTGAVSICQYKKKFKCGLFRVRMAAVKRRALPSCRQPCASRTKQAACLVSACSI